MDRTGGRARRVTLGRTVLLALVAGLLATEPVVAYRFWAWNQSDLVAAGAAMRWNEASLPLRFRSLENEHLPAILTEEEWREGVTACGGTRVSAEAGEAPG